MFSVLWSNLIDYLFLYVFILYVCIDLLIQKSACLGLHTIYFHSIWKTSPFSLETHSSPAPMVTSLRSPRPFLDGARAPRRFVAGVCVCVCFSSGGRITSNYPPAHNDSSSRFQCPRKRRPSRPTSGSCHGLYSFASFFSGEFIASLSELS